MTRTKRLWFIVLLAMIAGITLASCGRNYSLSPSAYHMPNGAPCAPWVSNPYETQGQQFPACPYPIPQQRPTMMPGMSPADYNYLNDYYTWGGGHSDYYFSDGYYNSRIGPAWQTHPGTYYGYGRQPVVHYTTINDYRGSIRSYDSSNASVIATAKSNPKYSTYTGSDGKSYTGKSVPPKSFSGGDAPAFRSGGNAGTNSTYGTSPNSSNTSRGSSQSGSNSYTGSTGKSGYSSNSSSNTSRSYSGGSSSSTKSGK